MSTEARKTRGQSKEKQDAPAKDKKEEKAGKSGEPRKNIDPPSNVKELDTQKSEVAIHPNVFQAVFYMKHFRVTDIIVKVSDHTLIIDACHREHADEHGLISRSMIRTQKLPKDVKLETLVCSFSGNGYLVIQAEISDKKSGRKPKSL